MNTTSMVPRGTTRCLDAVAEFHRHIGVVADPASLAQAALRTRLILEEYAETYAALQEGNIVEAADGLADLRYVVLGTAVVYGVAVPDVDFVPIVPPAIYDPAAVALAFGTVPVWDVVEELWTPVAPTPLADALQRLDRAVGRFAFTIGVPLDRVFWEVHRSNMTKAARNAGTGSKYGGVQAKGPGYSPPDIAGALGLSKVPS